MSDSRAPAPLTVLAIGDSLIKAEADERGGWARRFAEQLAADRGARLRFHGHGVSGDTALGVRERLPAALAAAPHWDLVILGFGINDSRMRGHPPQSREVPERAFAEGTEALLATLAETGSVARVLVAGIIPVDEAQTRPFKEDKHYARADALRYAHILRELVLRHEAMVLLDFTAHWEGLSETERGRLLPDGLHPGPAGHADLARVARDAWDHFS